MANTDDDAHAASCFSRSTGLPPHMGKATESVKTHLPPVVKEDFVRRCRETGMAEAELLRSWVMVHLYGLDAVASMERQRLQSIAAIGTETGR
jgi:hypothetical protein